MNDTHETTEAGDETITCDACARPYTNPHFTISRGVEIVEFPAGSPYPIVSPSSVDAIVQCCSQACLDSQRKSVLERDQVSATYPGIGPIEACSRCGGPVDMTRPHVAWTEDETIVDDGQLFQTATVIGFELLAVLCRRCMAQEAGAVEEGVSSPVAMAPLLTT
jgi:hypothetical protein